MAFFKLRSQRISVEVPVKIFLKRKDSGKVTSDCRQASLIKISKGGACFLIDSMILEGSHIFFSTQENQENHILLKRDDSVEDRENNKITAHSVWMDSVTKDEKQAFKVGVKFTESQDELFAELKKSSRS